MYPTTCALALNIGPVQPLESSMFEHGVHSSNVFVKIRTMMINHWIQVYFILMFMYLQTNPLGSLMMLMMMMIMMMIMVMMMMVMMMMIMMMMMIVMMLVMMLMMMLMMLMMMMLMMMLMMLMMMMMVMMMLMLLQHSTHS